MVCRNRLAVASLVVSREASGETGHEVDARRHAKLKVAPKLTRARKFRNQQHQGREKYRGRRALTKCFASAALPSAGKVFLAAPLHLHSVTAESRGAVHFNQRLYACSLERSCREPKTSEEGGDRISLDRKFRESRAPAVIVRLHAARSFIPHTFTTCFAGGMR